MKQIYEPAKIEIILFESEDIVTASGAPGDGGYDPGLWD